MNGKNRFALKSLYTGFLIFGIIFINSGCKDTIPDKEPTVADSLFLPKISTLSINSIGKTSAYCSTMLHSEGISPLTDRGVCWSTEKSPTLVNLHTNDGFNLGGSEAYLRDLTENTTYFVRSYAKNAEGIVYGNELSFTTLGNPIGLGKTYQGGIIFYIDGTGLHGLIAAPKDQGYAKWGCQGLDVLATSTALGKGDQSTYMIANQCSDLNTAGKICYDLTLNGYSDWYLPTKDELKLLHQNLYLKGIGDLKLDTYWSSSQYSKTNAWKQFFNQNVNQGNYDKDLIAYAVRAVRSF